ncbi:MAG: hypothetical protein M3R07_01240, partial [Gemmatimonadota bacterium]|nr:hypothetical protein [Gemmatimonadota bacterium]
ALQDVMPSDTVEVVNLGIAATNSYAIADLAPEVAAQHPDAVLIYAGHNEYYGALGAGSTESLGGFPAFVRLYLKLQHARVFLLLRNAVGTALNAMGSGVDPASRQRRPSMMETVVKDQRITLGGATYERGKIQFESNLRHTIGVFRRAGIPVFVGSTPSNLRDLRPFGSVGHGPERSAAVTFDSALAALARRDTARSHRLFSLARDLDVIRFRAPSEFNSLIKRVARTAGAQYVPVEEVFASSARHGVPGNDLFLEHVHPNALGQALIGKTYVDVLLRAPFLSGRADVRRLSTWDDYVRRTHLTTLDDRIAYHVVRTITTRWPFVPLKTQQDYRRTYSPSGFVDSLAFRVSTGELTWSAAKLSLAERFASIGRPDLEAAEYLGLVDREPRSELAHRLAARALLHAGKTVQARQLLAIAYSIEPTAFSAYMLGVFSLQDRKLASGTALLEKSLKLAPDVPAVLYQLSLGYAMSGNAEKARTLAERLAVVSPGYPGLAKWMSALGVERR